MVEGLAHLPLGDAELCPDPHELLQRLFLSELEAHDRREELALVDLREGLLDIIGKGLRDRAEIGVHVVHVALQVPEMRHENVIEPGVQDVLHRAVRDLGREAVGALGAGHAVVGYLLGEPHLDAQGMEKPGVEGPERVHGKRLGYAHHEIALLDKILFSRRAVVEHELFTLFDVVENHRFVDLFLFPHVGVLVAAAAEHVLVAVHVQDADGALVVACLAV